MICMPWDILEYSTIQNRLCNHATVTTVQNIVFVGPWNFCTAIFVTYQSTCVPILIWRMCLISQLKVKHSLPLLAPEILVS